MVVMNVKEYVSMCGVAGIGGAGGSLLALIGTSGTNLSIVHALKKFGSHPPPPESALEQLHMQCLSLSPAFGCRHVLRVQRMNLHV
eukprot:3903206-Amphidinium_carterae.2